MNSPMNRTLYLALMRLEDLATGRHISRHYQHLQRLKNADPEYLNEFRWNALKRLLRHAYANVPFYKKRFAAQEIHPEDIRSWADFAGIPPLTRADVKSQCDALISRLHAREDLEVGETSGSSGTPMIFYYDNAAYSAGRAAVLTGWELAGKKLGDKLVTVWGGRHTVEERWPKWGSRFKARLLRNKRIGAYALSDEHKIREALDIISSRKGGFIHGYTNALYMLATCAKDMDIAFEPKFDGVLTTSETLFPFQRRIIEDVFGPVYDGYGCLEILGIAFQCQEQKGYHIVEPNIIFEQEDCVDDRREIIVTDLWNYAFPLIRYKPGDLVMGETSRSCACGCTWTTCEKIDGRATDIITAPDGTHIYYIIWYVATEVLDNHPHIKQFQWVKVEKNRLILRLQVNYGDTKSIKDSVRYHVVPILKGKMEFDIEFVDKFEIGPSGKHKPVVDETR